MQNIHFIAIGGSAMHNLALALKNLGYKISGSDDKFFNPSKDRLHAAGLLPTEEGWNQNRIHSGLDAVIVGMHAKKDNPELLKAKELNIPIFSFPEFIYDWCKNKQRVVIAGSHGKTTITAMILHVLKKINKPCDYLLGATTSAFPLSVKLSHDAPMIIIEGDEYPCSPDNLNPKFSEYKHHIGLINGVSWDHANVYSSEKIYDEVFDKFADLTPKAGSLAYFEGDPKAKEIGNKERVDVTQLPYSTIEFKIENGKSFVKSENGFVEVSIFGEHNMQNLSAAKTILNRLRVTDEQFFNSIKDFQGASNRLELITENEYIKAYRDFAHAPSKVKATVEAVVKQFPGYEINAFYQLHTFSSLNLSFLPQYEGTLKAATNAIVYFNPENCVEKRLPILKKEEVIKSFNQENLQVIDENEDLKSLIENKLKSKNKQIMLFMSSGDWGGLDIKNILLNN